MTDRISEPKAGDKVKPRHRGPVWRRGGRLLVVVCLIAAFGIFGGFIWFAEQATNPSHLGAGTSADGIVVFTGGRDRIAVAASLLTQGRGRRLLISGVNPTTPRRDLEGLAPQMQRLSECCIDLGRQAEDTVGNARETADWARDHGFRSLLVVTSAFHLPRSLTELSSVMPNAKLTGVPVVSPHIAGSWWRDRAALRLLLAEYFKYLASLMRLTAMPGAISSGAEG